MATAKKATKKAGKKPKKTTRDNYSQNAKFDSETSGMSYGGLASDMTPAQKKAMKEAEAALRKIAGKKV